MKQATAILAKHVVDMHKRKMCCLTFDCWMPRLLGLTGVLFMIRELPTYIPFYIHVQLCCYFLVVVVVSHTYSEKKDIVSFLYLR